MSGPLHALTLRSCPSETYVGVARPPIRTLNWLVLGSADAIVVRLGATIPPPNVAARVGAASAPSFKGSVSRAIVSTVNDSTTRRAQNARVKNQNNGGTKRRSLRARRIKKSNGGSPESDALMVPRTRARRTRSGYSASSWPETRTSFRIRCLPKSLVNRPGAYTRQSIAELARRLPRPSRVTTTRVWKRQFRSGTNNMQDDRHLRC